MDEKKCDYYAHLELLAKLAKSRGPVHFNALLGCDIAILPYLQREGLISKDTATSSYQISRRGRDALDEMVHNFKCFLWDSIAL